MAFDFNLLHSGSPKLHTILAFLSAIRLKVDGYTRTAYLIKFTELQIRGVFGGWSGGAMVLGKLQCPTIWITVGQGPTALAVGAGGGCLDIFTLIYPFSPLSPSL